MLNKISKLAKRYEQILSKKAESDHSQLGVDFLHNFEGMEHNALITLAQGMGPYFDNLIKDIEEARPFTDELKIICEKKAQVFRKAAQEMVPLDREMLGIMSKAFDYDTDEEFSFWENTYPDLKLK